jgi:flagellar hook-associated protein 3 FlgL
MINATGNRMTQEIARQSRLAAQIATKQAQVSSGKRLQRASDDPVATARLANLKRAQANDAARAANIGFAITQMAQADTQLRSVSDLLARAKELTVAGANGASSPADRGTIAAEIVAIADEIDAASLTRSANGEALFALGNSRIVRFDDHITFAPVPTRSAAFETGGVSISQILHDGAAAVAEGNAPLIASAVTLADSAIDHVADVSAVVGINAARLERLQESSAERAISIGEERSGLEDTDLSSAIAELNGMTLTLEAAQAAFARINRRTLMDFLT